MKKHLKRAISIIGIILASLVFLIVVLLFNELRSLQSIEQVDDFPMYTMTYYGDYGFDEFLKEGAKDDSSIEQFVTKRLLKGIPVDLGVVGDGCTAFVAENEAGELIYGRNFDYDYSPSLQLITTPENGYRSISTVNLNFAGYGKDNLPDGLSLDSIATLSAPYLPVDGMNEKGFAVALLVVPEAPIDQDETKVSLNTTTAVRLLLDKAATVDEAVELLESYNIYFSGDLACHFLVADALGNSALIEFWDGELQVVTSPEDYQIASNFIAYNNLNIGIGYDEFERYNKVKDTLISNSGKINEEAAVNLLTSIGLKDNDTADDLLQWSVIYNLTNRTGRIFADHNTDNIQYFDLD